MLGRCAANGFGQLEVVAEDPVVAKLELADARGFLLLVEQRLDPVFPVLDEIQQFVQFGVVALLEQPAFGDELRRIVGKGFLQRGGVVADHPNVP